MEVLPWVFSSGWASGINGYAVVLLLGLLGRFTGVDGVPPALERTDVLVAAAVLTLLDLVADKVPYLDSAWDAVHTAIRPAIGAAVGALLAGEAGSPNEAVGAATGGLTALASHVVKAGLRLAVNASPEPASNLVVSTAEDLTVASGGGRLGALAVAGRRGGRRAAARRAGPGHPAGRADPPVRTGPQGPAGAARDRAAGGLIPGSADCNHQLHTVTVKPGSEPDLCLVNGR